MLNHGGGSIRKLKSCLCVCVSEMFLLSCTFIECTLRQKPLYGKKQTEHFRQRQALKRRVWTASLRLHIKPIVLRDHVGLHREQKLINLNDQASQQPVSWASASMRCAKQHGHKWKTISSSSSSSRSVCLFVFLQVYKTPLPALVNTGVRCIGEKRWRSLCLEQSSTNSTDSMSEKLTRQNNQTGFNFFNCWAIH